MRTLLLTSAPISAGQLRDVVGPEGLSDEIVVIAPALHTSALRFWISDADEAIGRAEWVREKTVESLDDADVEVTSDIGEGDTAAAIEDTLATFDAERIFVFTRPDDPRYRETVDTTELRRRFGIPVDHVTLAAPPTTK